MRIELTVIIWIGLFMMLLILSFLFFLIRSNQKFTWFKQEAEKEISRANQEIQRQALNNISYDIIDNFGNSLSTINLNIASILSNSLADINKKIVETEALIQQSLGEPLPSTFPAVLTAVNLNLTAITGFSGHIKEKSIEAKSLVKQLQKDTQEVGNRITTNYMNYLVENGFQRAFENDLERLTNFIIHKDVQGSEYKLDTEKEIVLLRICQEILNNIEKHSRAQHVRVLLDYSPLALRLAISDDGVGFDYERIMAAPPDHRKTGLKNILTRSELIKADLHIQSRPAQGTTISFTIPVS